MKSKNLFDTTEEAGLKMKNRFVRSSIGEHIPDGKVNAQTIDKYTRLAQGGVGTILTGFTLVDGRERSMGIEAIYDDSFIPGNRQLVDAVHANGANILMQLVVIGSNYNFPGHLTGEILSASAVPNPKTGVVPRAMTVDEIHHTVRQFAEAAVRAKKAGYDGVEIHAAHGYLLNQFASPMFNRRTDEYGGSRENRYRITVETYDAIREAVGPDYPVWIKVQSDDGFPGGVTHDDCLYLCRELARRGINAIEVSGPFWLMRGDSAYFEPIADRIARETAAPVIVTGGNRDFDMMQRMIQTTAIDYVGLARPLAAHPDLINQFLSQYTE